MAQETQERKLVELKVKVNKYISVNINIPTELDCMEFKSVTTMATKIFSLSKASKIEDRPSKEPKQVHGNIRWSKKEKVQEINFFKNNKDKNALEKRAVSYGLTLQKYKKRVYQAKWYLKSKGAKK